MRPGRPALAGPHKQDARLGDAVYIRGSGFCGISATASATIPVLAGAVSVLLWLFVDAPHVRADQGCERRAVQAGG
jgi:hypothetical protein